MSIPKIGTKNQEAIGDWKAEPKHHFSDEDQSITISIVERSFSIIDNEYFKKLFDEKKLVLQWNFYCDATYYQISGTGFQEAKLEEGTFAGKVVFDFALYANEDFTLDILNNRNCFDSFYDSNLEIKKGKRMSSIEDRIFDYEKSPFGSDPNSFIKVSYDPKQTNSHQLEVKSHLPNSRPIISLKDEKVYLFFKKSYNSSNIDQRDSAIIKVVYPMITSLFLEFKKDIDEGEEPTWHTFFIKSLGFNYSEIEGAYDIEPTEAQNRFLNNFYSDGRNVYTKGVLFSTEEEDEDEE